MAAAAASSFCSVMLGAGVERPGGGVSFWRLWAFAIGADRYPPDIRTAAERDSIRITIIVSSEWCTPRPGGSKRDNSAFAFLFRTISRRWHVAQSCAGTPQPRQARQIHFGKMIIRTFSTACAAAWNNH